MMSIQFGIYDFFAYSAPGGLYLLSLVYILTSFAGVKFDFASLRDLSIIQVVMLTIPAYIVGLVVDRIAVFWYRNFEPKQLEEGVQQRYRKEYSNLKFDFQIKDWAVLIAYLQREKAETTGEIHRFNAIHIMMKNASFNFIILTVTEIVLFFTRSLDWLHLFIGISFAVASIISARQAARFKRWFFSGIFEAIIAKSLEQDDLITKQNPGEEDGELVSTKHDNSKT